MNDKSEWENLSNENRLDLTKLSRAVIRGSIIEDAATRFMAMCIAEAVAKQKAKTADELEALRAENARYRGELGRIARLTSDPWAEDVACAALETKGNTDE